MQTIKCVAVGDKGVGKRTLLTFIWTSKPPLNFHTELTRPYDSSPVIVKMRGNTYSLLLSDTIGNEDHDLVRSLDYPGTNVFLVCFSVVSPSSYDSVSTKWHPEITRHCPGTPFLLVGTQIDLRDGNQQNSITHAMGQALANAIGAVGYVECTCLTGKGVNNVLDVIIRAA